MLHLKQAVRVGNGKRNLGLLGVLQVLNIEFKKPSRKSVLPPLVTNFQMSPNALDEFLHFSPGEYKKKMLISKEFARQLVQQLSHLLPREKASSIAPQSKKPTENIVDLQVLKKDQAVSLSNQLENCPTISLLDIAKNHSKESLALSIELPKPPQGYWSPACSNTPPKEDLPSQVVLNAAYEANLTDIQKFCAEFGIDSVMQCKTVDSGATPLHILSKNSDLDALKVVDMLCELGADSNVVAFNGSTPLHWAAAAGLTETVKVLLKRGADPEARTFTWRRNVFGKGSGQTPAHWAAESGNTHVLRILLDHSPLLVGASDERENLPVDLAKKDLRSDAVQLLDLQAQQEYVCMEISRVWTGSKAL